jgi:hypothetical protein
MQMYVCMYVCMHVLFVYVYVYVNLSRIIYIIKSYIL